MSEPRELFGGAILAAIPDQFADVSRFREVPDNQEVFVSLNNDDSIIIELVEMDTSIANADSARFHFNHLTEDNQAHDARVLEIVPIERAEMPHMPDDAVGFMLAGQQRVAKFREQASEESAQLDLLLAVIRLPHVTTDLLITVNVPETAVPSNSCNGPVEQNPADQRTTESLFRGGIAQLRTLVTSIQVTNWGLFDD